MDGEGMTANEIQEALVPLLGKILKSITVEEVGDVDQEGGAYDRLTLCADDGTSVTLCTQDSDEYRSWFRIGK